MQSMAQQAKMSGIDKVDGKGFICWQTVSTEAVV
jgi:hypothetical protein